MHLRDLQLRDAERMLEWMHDPSVVNKLQTDFLSKTIEDCNRFIANSQNYGNIHLAITDDNDRYMGTVSLKNMTGTAAEFAITVSRDAMGKGYAIWAMQEIIKRGFVQYGLTDIYWCVAPDNMRALKFYDKNGFERVLPDAIKHIEGYTCEQINTYVWYLITSIAYEKEHY